jgi:hypothetical protein
VSETIAVKLTKNMFVIIFMNIIFIIVFYS